MQADNFKHQAENDQNKRKNKNEIENFKELNSRLEEKLKACTHGNTLLSSDLERNLLENLNSMGEQIENFSVETSKHTNRADGRKRNRFRFCSKKKVLNVTLI